MPSVYSGARLGRGGVLRKSGQNAADIANPNLSRSQQRRQIDFIQSLNQGMLDRVGGTNQNIEGVIESFEPGFRMQDAMPSLMDISGETAETLNMYGIGQGATDSFGKQCLMARRFAESGVRFVEITYGTWDHHSKIMTSLPTRCEAVDRPIAACCKISKTATC